MKTSNQTREGMGYEFFFWLLPIVPSLNASREQQAARFLNRFDAAANAPDTPSQCNDESACHRRIEQGEREREGQRTAKIERERALSLFLAWGAEEHRAACMRARTYLQLACLCMRACT